MDFNQLRSWLELPPGSWPPDHYTLLGLAFGAADPDSVEPRVLQRMDRLRHHQLLHPELVTEGMNRLAQALITLTDPVGRSAYEAELGIKPQAAISLPRVPDSSRPPPSSASNRPIPVVVAEPVLDEDDALDEEPLPTEQTEPTELTQEIAVEAREPLYELVPLPPHAVAEEEVEAEPEPEAFDLPSKAEVTLPPVRSWPTPPSSRRWIYTRLAQIRRALRGWEKLRLILGDPQDPIDRPSRVLLLLEAVRETVPHLQPLRGIVGDVGEPGGIVAAIIRQPLLLDTIRRLLPDQREALAIDWRRGERAMQREYARLRLVAREARDRAEGLQRLPEVIRWIRDYPEILLIPLAMLALFVALVRRFLNGGTSP